MSELERLRTINAELYEAMDALLNADGRWRDYIADAPVEKAQAALAKAQFMRGGELG